MSTLRPETRISHDPAPTNGTAYLMIYTAVQHQPGLVHGALHAHGAHCAIGSFFTDNPKTALYDSLIDEVAMVNDSVPTWNERRRKLHVLRWLRWKLQQLHMPLPGRSTKGI